MAAGGTDGNYVREWEWVGTYLHRKEYTCTACSTGEVSGYLLLPATHVAVHRNVSKSGGDEVDCADYDHARQSRVEVSSTVLRDQLSSLITITHT